ncbi:trypsin-like peptidase domain-containing protein [Bartonella apis]|uniref:trypsin-like peptidase domain-containing protein n=1 Tax=Bartonella apis TaxID=1686310 RepID=UPI0018DECECB|nr:trypsin-like peptidase domain-containing protein [Bartonella apis]MBI0177003.1 trypsin-like peptidase domain-containing protein [Bartonella apis]
MRCFVPWLLSFLLILITLNEATWAETPSSNGSGFAVTDDGWILTNAHVVKGCQRVEISNTGQAEDIRFDSHDDLALIKAPAGVKTQALFLRRDTIRLGEDIIALGFPLNGILSDSIKMTTGNVNALSGLENDARYLQISTPVQPGNSGGPVIDRNGHVIGITTLQLSKNFEDKTGIMPQNINFALRASVAAIFMEAQGLTVSYADDDKGAPVPSTADITEKTTPSVYKILCYAATPTNESNQTLNQPLPQSNPPTGVQGNVNVLPVNPPTVTFINQNNYDAIGFDYRSAKHVSFDNCLQMCENDGRCQALTYHKRLHACMLKYDVIALIRNKDAAAAFISSKRNSVKITDFMALSNMDITGGDYTYIENTDYFSCFIGCIGDQRCIAFSFIPRKKQCWLKDHMGTLRAKKGVELGVK